MIQQDTNPRTANQGFSRPVTRRAFVGMGATTGGLLALGLNPLGAMASAAQRLPLVGTLPLATFLRARGQRFGVWSNGQKTTFLLESVKNLKEPGASRHSECFSLTFKREYGRAISQGTYRFTNNEIGTFKLFVVPQNQTEHSTSVTAVINRL